MSLEFPYLLSAPFPILTPRLMIRPPQEGDGPAFQEAISQSVEHLRTYLPWAQTEPTAEETENTARRHHVEYLKRENFVLALFDRSTHQLLGGSGLHRINWNTRRFEIGYWIRATEEGKGYISEAVNAITRYAFQQFEANRVEIRCSSTNIRSKLVAERLGFQLEGCLRRDHFLPGTKVFADTLVFSRLDMERLPTLDITW